MSKKTPETTAPELKDRGWHEWDYHNLAVSRCNAANELTDELISSIQTAYFRKNLSIDDLVDVFNIPKIILNLLITAPDEYEQEWTENIEPYRAPVTQI